MNRSRSGAPWTAHRAVAQRPVPALPDARGHAAGEPMTAAALARVSRAHRRIHGQGGARGQGAHQLARRRTPAYEDALDADSSRAPARRRMDSPSSTTCARNAPPRLVRAPQQPLDDAAQATCAGRSRFLPGHRAPRRLAGRSGQPAHRSITRCGRAPRSLPWASARRGTRAARCAVRALRTTAAPSCGSSARALALRRARPELFAHGDYRPVARQRRLRGARGRIRAHGSRLRRRRRRRPPVRAAGDRAGTAADGQGVEGHRRRTSFVAPGTRLTNVLTGSRLARSWGAAARPAVRPFPLRIAAYEAGRERWARVMSGAGTMASPRHRPCRPLPNRSPDHE